MNLDQKYFRQCGAQHYSLRLYHLLNIECSDVSYEQLKPNPAKENCHNPAGTHKTSARAELGQAREEGTERVEGTEC